MKFSSSDLATIIKGELFGPGDIDVYEIATDSRQLSFAGDTAFLAIKGKNHNGHNYLEQAYYKGIRVFIISDMPVSNHRHADAAYILTDDTVEALQTLATEARQLFRGTVIAVTGSAGKTIVKEWLSEIAGRSAATVRSPKSYNSQIGVPLSVLKLDNKFHYGIFEAGISKPGEMEKLRRIINPDIGIITNIGDAHSENFATQAEKAAEKLVLFENARVIIFPSDQVAVKNELTGNDKLRSKELIGWSFSDKNASIYIRKELSPKGKTKLEVLYKGHLRTFEIPFTDRASVENAVSVAAACLVLGIDDKVLTEGLAGLVSVAMRMDLKTGINNCHLIEDYYNSDPGSLVMALEFVKSQNGRKTTLILSDFIESGRSESDLYGEVAALIRKSGIDRFIGIGQSLYRNSHLFPAGSLFFFSTTEFISDLNPSSFRDEIILVKGARSFEFEKIGRLLEQQVHMTILEVSLDAIAQNLNEFRRLLNPGTRVMAMVKAFAYGAGPAEIAGLLEYHRVSYLAVACTDEGIELRNGGVTLPIMIMNPDPSSYDVLIRANLEPVIFSLTSLARFTDIALKHGLSRYPVHIKIDTGMHRLGFMPDDMDELVDSLSKTECIRVISVFSHLAGSDDQQLDPFTHRQAVLFLEASARIRSATGYPFLRHILNTSGIARFPEYQFEMVRPGIGIYGIGRYDNLSLRPAGCFKTKISQVKRINAGEPVGYGCTDVSDTDRLIAILPVGYADGLNRKLGNRNGSLFIRGKRVPIIGNICMDMCMADISGTEAAEGDEAEIFGRNIPIEELAGICGTIPYEVLTSIPGRVKRVFFRE